MTKRLITIYACALLVALVGVLYLGNTMAKANPSVGPHRFRIQPGYCWPKDAPNYDFHDPDCALLRTTLGCVYFNPATPLGRISARQNVCRIGEWM